MNRFLNFLEESFSSYLLFISFSLAASTVFSKGDPGIFFSGIWITIFIFSGIYLTIVAITRFLKKKHLNGTILLLSTLLMTLYFFNTAHFEYSHIPVGDFNSSKEKLLENDRVMLLEHGFGDTEKLKNYEKAVFLYNSQEIEVKLNKPLKMTNERKLFLTGNGKSFLITRSKHLTALTLVSFLLVVISLMLMGKKWKL